MRVFVFHVCDALIAEQTSVPVGVPRQAFEFLQWGLYSAVLWGLDSVPVPLR